MREGRVLSELPSAPIISVGVQVGRVMAASQWEWHLFSDAHLFILPAAFLLPLRQPFPPLQLDGLPALPPYHGASSQKAGEQWVRLVQMLSHASKGEGFDRTQTQTQTIIVTLADCLSATEPAVEGWLVQGTVWTSSGISPHTQPSKSHMNCLNIPNYASNSTRSSQKSINAQNYNMNSKIGAVISQSSSVLLTLKWASRLKKKRPF